MKQELPAELIQSAEQACSRVGFLVRHVPFWPNWIPPGSKEPAHWSTKLGATGANKGLWERFSGIRSIGQAPSFLLSGSVGCGKSSLLAGYCKVLFVRRYEHLAGQMTEDDQAGAVVQFSGQVRYIRHNDLNDLFRDVEEGGDEVAALTRSDLLIVDDIGTEKDTDWVMKEFLKLIDYRWGNNLPTWLASNHSRSEMVKCDKNGQPVLDRNGGLQCLWPGWERIMSRIFDSQWMRYAELVGNFREHR